MKGLKERPAIGPSGMEAASEAGPSPKRAAGRRRRRRGAKNLTIHEERVVKAASVPRGSRSKGHETFVVQDLILRPHVIRWRRERWLTPDGSTITAPLPESVVGHFGPGLRRFILAQYHQGQVTMPRTTTPP